MAFAMTSAADHAWNDAVASLDAARSSGDLVDDLDVLANLANAALQLGDDEAPGHYYGLVLSRARESGACWRSGPASNDSNSTR